MKFHLLLPLFLSALFCNAQITMTSADFPVIGTVIQNKACDYPGASSAGANQVWDWSMVQPNLTTTPRIVVPASNLNCAPSGATHALKYSNSDNYVYYKVNSSYVEYVGESGCFVAASGPTPFGSITTCSNNKRIIQYPLTFGSSWSNSWNCVDNSPSIEAESYDDFYTVDGFGDIILPFGTVSNVLKVNIYSIGGNSGGIFYRVDTTTHEVFYKPGYGIHLAMSTDRVSWYPWGGSGAILDQRAHYLDVLSVSTIENSDHSIGIELFPNPATSQALVRYGTKGNTIIQVFDAHGKLVIELQKGKLQPGIHQEQLDLSELDNGIYTVLVSSESGDTGSSRILVSK